MSRFGRTFVRITLGLILTLLAAMQPLQAQLDTKLQTGTTDFLDLYQQSVNLVMKPEVVTVFDFSGSMGQVMYHKDYTGGGDETNAGMSFTRSSPAAGRYDVTVSLNSGINLTGGKLVRPNGDLLEYASGGDTTINTSYVTSGLPGETASPLASDVRNWIRSASHVRFTNGGKTFDLPLCWTILDADTTVDLTNTDVNKRKYRKSYNSSYPLKMTIINPSTTSNTEIEMDSAYRVMTNNTGSYGMYSSTTGSSPMTACTFRNGNNGGANFVGWGGNYIKWIFQTSTTIPQATTASGKAFANGIPGRTRVQAVKDAAMRAWCKYHNKVFWAYRFLKYYGISEGTTSGQYDSASNPSNDSRNNQCASDPTSVPVYGESQRAWTLLNDDLPANGTTKRSDAGLKRLAAMVCSGSTPLNSALSNTLAQLNDPNCVFNDIETGVDKPVECRNTYVLLFTDGIPNTDPATPTNVNTPYISSGTGTALAGNNFFRTAKTRIDTSSSTSYYNIINFAALAAHGGETDNGGFVVPTYSATTQTYPGTTGPLASAWIPFWIRSRGAGAENITFKDPRPITTMTVGVSLSGTKTSTSGTKYRLFAAAACGDPARKDWNLDVLTEFTLIDDTDPTKGKKANSTYFFDATDPQKLTTGLDAAFYELSLSSNVNATSNPNLPFVGAAFGSQVYFGKFQPPTTGGVIWKGDLLMFGTREVAGNTLIINKKGDEATLLDETTALWTASSALDARLWSARKLYTRLPSSSATESAIKKFTYTGTDYTDATNGLKNYVATNLGVGTAAQQAVIQFAMGGDTSTVAAPTAPTANRSSIMGDIINSAPAALEYKWDDVKTALAGYPRLAAVITAGGNRFRLILVGTNQGWLHAFGEVTRTTTITDTAGKTQSIVTGDVDELWSFMPTDFLAQLDYLTGSSKAHRFMVDGTPALYHLDLPPSGGGFGNGVVDSTERAIAVVGLRKGGRSYYALDIHDPFTPSMKWALVPDEADNFPTGRIVTDGPPIATVKAILKKWGFSTSTPAFGRVKFKDTIRDAVFLGGGFSVPEVDANFPNALGRSVMALDVYSGAVLAATDLTDAKIGGTTVGPVSAGLIPFEFVLGSGMAQRAYFLDYKGGLWSWGSSAVSAETSYKDFRIDSSELTDWSIRKVYQDDDTTALGMRYTTVPAPFRVGVFPGVGKSGTAAPAAVGVAMVSGDRNNPLDNNYNLTDNLSPLNHRLTVVFDRQDSRAWGLDKAPASGPDPGIGNDELADFSGNIVSTTPADKCTNDIFKFITPGCEDYYLAPYDKGPPVVLETPKFGYYINFPEKTANNFIAKGINPPIVVAGSLFYTYFSPESADPCTGGSGVSKSFLICDVINPIAEDKRTGLRCLSGLKDTWVGVASDYIALGTRSVIQAGSVGYANPDPKGTQTKPELHSTDAMGSQRYPKTRVWRTVH